MKRNMMRQNLSRLLLVVYLPIMLLASHHVHYYQQTTDDECAQCVSHQPHDGHFRTAQICMHDCVLCQLMQMPFVPSVAVVLSLGLLVVYAFRRSDDSMLVTMAKGSCQLRAPPFCLMS